MEYASMVGLSETASRPGEKPSIRELLRRFEILPSLLNAFAVDEEARRVESFA